jgi:hypothetical protein
MHDLRWEELDDHIGSLSRLLVDDTLYLIDFLLTPSMTQDSAVSDKIILLDIINK